jgi:hypothetical protein
LEGGRKREREGKKSTTAKTFIKERGIDFHYVSCIQLCRPTCLEKVKEFELLLQEAIHSHLAL